MNAGMRGDRGGVNQHFPPGIFSKILVKNGIKAKIGNTPYYNFFRKALVTRAWAVYKGELYVVDYYERQVRKLIGEEG
jgi:hypothetical protein